MKILNNKKYKELINEKNEFKNKYILLLEDNRMINEQYKIDEDLLSNITDGLITLKSKVVGPISNTKVKKDIENMLKMLGVR